MKILNAIEMTETLYGETIDSRASNDSVGLDIGVHAHIAFERCGLGVELARAYVATRRQLQRMEPARDPFAEFAV